MNRKLAAWTIALLLIPGGCATTRGVVDLPTPSTSEPTDSSVTTPSATETATATEVTPSKAVTKAIPVFIASIEDNRVFELKPGDPSTPSLKDGQIDNRQLTSRAIARKRNSWGKALGDVMLPEDRSVMQVIEENLTKTLEENGYRVVEEPGEGVAEIAVNIEKFWAWFTPGFWALKIEFQSELKIESTLPALQSDTVIKGYAHQKHQAATGGAWVQTMQVGMDDLRSNLSKLFATNKN